MFRTSKGFKLFDDFTLKSNKFIEIVEIQFMNLIFFKKYMHQIILNAMPTNVKSNVKQTLFF